MNRPSSEAAGTIALLAVILSLAVGALLLSRSSSDDPPEATPSTDAPTVSQAPVASPPVSPAPDPSAPAPPSATASACPSLSTKIPFRVLTLNVHGGRGPYGFSMDRLARFISSADVDVALLQEVDRDRPRSRRVDMPTALARATGMQVAYGVNVNLGPRRGVSGVATLSRHPITYQVNTRLPHQPGGKQRGVLRTDLDLDGTTISVFNTHLEPGAVDLRSRQMSAAVSSLSASKYPRVLGGDLNSVPSTTPVRIARGALRDAWLDAGRGPSLTSPARRPHARIDYLMYADPIRVTRTEVLPSLVSDHRGVRARFVLSVAGDKVCVPVLDGAVGSGDG